MAWSTLIVGAGVALIALELGSACPPGGPLSFGACEEVRPIGVAVVGVTVALYVGALSAVMWWTRGLRARGVADPRAARDWYLLAAAIGLVVAPLLAFTVVSAFR